ncbi:hypothetical protein MPSEU_000778200 [Mayamaea pseudoterrestris]|nr:hypothetical protein MPSEU_000778200 [Mayamaea pseudoterrestris]
MLRSADLSLRKRKRQQCKIGWLILSSLLIAAVFISQLLLETTIYLNPLLLLTMEDYSEQAYMSKLAKRWLHDERTSPFPQPSPDEDCSCWNPDAKPPCCERTFRRAHKMGYVLTERLFTTKTFGARISTTQSFRRFPAEHDYRDVVLVRNFYDSIASGYLYHKQGKECWLDHVGRRFTRRGKWGNDNFQKFAGGEKSYIKYELDPPAKPGDTLCHYLANNSEKVGMRAYMSWILNNGYEGVISSYVYNMFDPFNRTRYICYKDMSDPEQDLRVINECLDWWFPTGHGAWDGRKPTKTKEYSGNHATSHDPNLRRRLRRLIEELDEKYFEGVVAWADSSLPCQ